MKSRRPLSQDLFLASTMYCQATRKLKSIWSSCAMSGRRWSLACSLGLFGARGADFNSPSMASSCNSRDSMRTRYGPSGSARASYISLYEERKVFTIVWNTSTMLSESLKIFSAWKDALRPLRRPAPLPLPSTSFWCSCRAPWMVLSAKRTRTFAILQRMTACAFRSPFLMAVWSSWLTTVMVMAEPIWRIFLSAKSPSTRCACRFVRDLKEERTLRMDSTNSPLSVMSATTLLWMDCLDFRRSSLRCSCCRSRPCSRSCL
mmetsp:Transcript_70263/g.209436  ORF Transcript_70263/g.209436 Transcript_70263/m.209436 type:complete len:261 (-) Transcript_70263:969-1751(-)